ncbi:hypothetical protein phiOC_p098 [Ochrobactrum phage vB_OspM_OC]|nr:hypothetical protein phiOC_p098 [Ochrobactrum phage vB_OspM_OC]
MASNNLLLFVAKLDTIDGFRETFPTCEIIEYCANDYGILIKAASASGLVNLFIPRRLLNCKFDASTNFGDAGFCFEINLNTNTSIDWFVDSKRSIYKLVERHDTGRRYWYYDAAKERIAFYISSSSGPDTHCALTDKEKIVMLKIMQLIRKTIENGRH